MPRTVNMDVPNIPSNVNYIEFEVTDGDPSVWPDKTIPVVDSNGHVNFFEYLPPENGKNLQWRMQVGEAVAKDLDFPVGPSYILKSFPDGYRFFDHHKGPAAKPRQDVYLYGPVAKRFRSRAEFIPHAIWLLNRMKGSCDCKYCSRRTQKEITAEMGAAGILPVASISASPAPGMKRKPREQRTRESRRRETRTYAAVRPVPKVLKPSPGILKQSVLVDRDNDLRAIYQQPSMELRRWFREEEVVWCALENAIVVSENPNISIRYWPGVVDEVKFKVESSRRPPDVTENLSNPQVEVASQPTQGTEKPHEEPIPWTVRHYTKYQTQLLAVSQSHIAIDRQVLPYQAHIPPEELINFMLTFDPDKLVFETESLSRFNPYSQAPISVVDAVSAYAAALQIASTLASFWSLTDDYEVKYPVSSSPPTSPKPARVPLPTRMSLSTQSHLTQTPAPPVADTVIAVEDSDNLAGKSSAEALTDTTPHIHFRDVHGLDSDLDRSELQRTSRRIIGTPPALGVFVQTRFQGIWWGTERIWVDDLIRLKVPRRTLAPSGTDHILAPSGPGKARLQTYRDLGADDEGELGAGGRGIFLRLSGIFAVDVPAEDGTKKEARVCGSLYELADEDWEELLSVDAQNNPDSKPVEVGQPGPSSLPNPTVAGEGVVLARSGASEQLNYPLPQAPQGFKFRPILNPGYEFIGALGLVCGRYYPRILSHPQLQPIVETPITEIDSVSILDNLWALEGLSGGYFNSMDPIKYKNNRKTMLLDADREALGRLKEYAEQKQLERQGVNGNSDNMDVDFDDIYV